MTDRRVTHLLAPLAAALLLAGCGTVTSSASTAVAAHPSPAVAASARPTPTPTPKGIPIPTLTVVPSADPAAVVRSTVTAGDPRLLPTYIPSGMSPTVRVSPVSYGVGWTDDLHTRNLDIAVDEGVNPPPITGPNGSETHPQFRGVRALYTVYDTTAPASQRYLLWWEPGTWQQSVTKPPGIEYFLAASGLTEAEFFRVADSLQPVG